MTEIRTDRLLLRGWRDDDLDAVCELNADPEVMRFVGEGAPYDRVTSAEAFAVWRRHWDEHGYGLFAAELLDASTVIGFVGLMQPAFLPAVMPAVEIGWRLMREHWGRGLATEAALAVRDHGFGALGLDRVISIIRPPNVASRRVAEKLGMSVEREIDHPVHGWPLLIYATLSER